MASISPVRVAEAAAAITNIGGSRADADIQKFLVLKRMGLTPDKVLTISNQAAISVCDELFGVSGREPSSWYDPLSGIWGAEQPNGGWPVGSVKTQLERPNRKLRAILKTEKEGKELRVSLKTDGVDYTQILKSQLKGKRFPLSEAIVWFFRDRSDLPDKSEIDISELLDDFIHKFCLSEDELTALFTDLPGGMKLPLTTDWAGDTIGLLLPAPKPPKERAPVNPAEKTVSAEDGYEWTKIFSGQAFSGVDVRDIVETVKNLADERDLVLPDEDLLIERCVVALLSGNLVLQGPPGTGKTTLARLLAEAFSADTVMTTATADWTTYEVIGGLRPTHDGSLEPVLGCVPATALACAEKMRACESSDLLFEDAPGPVPEARWLIIDELNRADIDRAIGGLYTVLSSTDGRHLHATPIDLWFEQNPKRRLLWVPGRFRIIGTMNDVDTSFVNSISQGLTRRFQFVYVGVPSVEQVDSEINLCRRQAETWLGAQYPDMVSGKQGDITPGNVLMLETALFPIQEKMNAIFKWLRYGNTSENDSGQSWPIGSAQAVDLWKAVLLTVSSGSDVKDEALVRALDASFADRIIPQMSTLRASHITQVQAYFDSTHEDLPETRRAIRHLRNTQSVR